MELRGGLDDLLARWADHMLAEGSSAKTVKTRTSAVRSYARGADPIAGTVDDARRFLAGLLTTWTRVTYHASLTRWHAWLVDEGVREDDPMTRIRGPRRPRGSPRPVTQAQLRKALGAATGRTRAYLVLAAYQGLRVHEIAQIRGEDVDDFSLRVIGKGQVAADLPTHPLTWRVALDYPTRGWWFPSYGTGGHILAESVSRALSRLFTDVGITATAHSCRHYHATELLRSGANIRVVQTSMRHASLTSTALYTAVNEDEVRAAVLGLPDLFAA